MNHYIHRYQFKAMGCQMSIWLALDDRQWAEQVLREAAAMFTANEKRLTRFDEQSELSHLNAQPGQWVPVSETLWQIVNQAYRLAQETDGLFDPTLLNQLEAAGYRQSFEEMADQPQPAPPDSLETGRYEAIQFDRATQAIRVPARTRLDLGGIGKGFTAQQVVDFLGNWGPCLVDAGGDLTAGDGPTGQPGWPVGVAMPGRESSWSQNLCSIWLRRASLATSGIDYRRWEVNGRQAHHIIDPRTGRPAKTDIISVSVLASTAMAAESWATATLIAGSYDGYRQLTGQGIAAALITKTDDLLLTPLMRPSAQLPLNARVLEPEQLHLSWI